MSASTAYLSRLTELTYRDAAILGHWQFLGLAPKRPEWADGLKRDGRQITTEQVRLQVQGVEFDALVDLSNGWIIHRERVSP